MTGGEQDDPKEKVKEMGIHRPGTLFKVDGHRFLSRGLSNQEKVPVIRLDTAERDTLDVDLLWEDYNNGLFSRLDTYDRSQETAIANEHVRTISEVTTAVSAELELVTHLLPAQEWQVEFDIADLANTPEEYEQEDTITVLVTDRQVQREDGNSFEEKAIGAARTILYEAPSFDWLSDHQAATLDALTVRKQ